jgi:hypothetical protein
MTMAKTETLEQAERRRAGAAERARLRRANNPDKAAEIARRLRDKRHALRAADPEWDRRSWGTDEVPGALRSRIDQEKLNGRVSLDDLTVLTLSNDPYRMHTGVGHRQAAWFKEHLGLAGVTRQIHLRGFHYRLVARGDVKLPNGMRARPSRPSTTSRLPTNSMTRDVNGSAKQTWR